MRAALLIAIPFATPAISQNISDPNACWRSQYPHGTKFNSTGSAPLTFSPSTNDKEPWYLSVGFNDSRPAGRTTEPLISAFVSVPESFVGSKEGNETRICVYRFAGTNATSDVSCKHGLSDKCIQSLRSTVPPPGQSCSSFLLPKDCTGSGYMFTSHPLNFTSTNCSTSSGLGGVDLPRSYRTYATGRGWFGERDAPGSYNVYDLAVQNPIPILISRSSGDGHSSNIALMCIAPSNVTEGSRVPSKNSFPPSAASGLNVGSASMTALVLSFVAVLLI